MRRIACLLTVLLSAALSPVAGARTQSRAGWDVAAQRTVMRAQLMAPLGDGRFHGDRRLTLAQLRAARDRLALRLGVPPVPAAGVSVAAFDALLVRQLGLADVAAAVRSEAHRAGLQPPARFGTEVVARALGLRFNHPWPGGELLEQYPSETITRAEAAWSLARVAGFAGWEAQSVRAAFAVFALPPLDRAQRAALRAAVSKIGMPYVWGGETDGVSPGQVHGGYDCSGFVWRVFGTAHVGGRTTADDQAHAIRRSQRIGFSEIRAGDLLFFGRKGHASHVGIALSADFMIHASAQGVYVSPLFDGRRRDDFLWARRVV